MRAILLLAVGAAALKAPKQTALAVRGGGDDSTNEIIMKASAAAATASGALTILDKSDLVEKYIFFGLNPATSGAAYGVALLGWGVGKINAVQSGANPGDMCRGTGNLVTWHQDRKCHTLEASTMDEMCRRMLVISADDMSPDTAPHGARETVTAWLSDTPEDHPDYTRRLRGSN